jgi:hypothetical protein
MLMKYDISQGVKKKPMEFPTAVLLVRHGSFHPIQSTVIRLDTSRIQMDKLIKKHHIQGDAFVDN